jgi:Bacterial antitoxin of type II TA system, VapB
VEAVMARHPGLSRLRRLSVRSKGLLGRRAVERLRSLAGIFEIDDVSAEGQFGICHTTWHMRTTLDLEDGLVEALMARHPGLSRTEAIERAIKVYLKGEAVERLLSLAGSCEIEDLRRFAPSDS